MIQGFHCPEGDVTFEHCSSCKRECRPRPYLDWLIENNKDRRNLLSPSMIWSCPRSVLLNQYTDYYVTPDSRYWMFYGTVVHSIMEQWKVEGIREKRINFKLGRFEMSGCPDCLIPCEGGYELIDFKTTNTVYKCKDSDEIEMKYLLKPEYEGQLAVYAHGLAQNGIKVVRAKLYYFARSSKSYIPCVTVPVEIKPAMVEEAIQRCEFIQSHFDNKTLPSYQDCQKEFNWKCKLYCEVNQFCWEDASQKGEL
jgi:hypothetical protein